MSDRIYEEWISIFETGTDYEADLVRDRLDDSGIEAVVLTQRDHAFNLNVGDLASVHVLVPPGRVEEARELLEGELISDEELEEAALNADPNAPPAHDAREEAALDSGIEEMSDPAAQDAEDEASEPS